MRRLFFLCILCSLFFSACKTPQSVPSGVLSEKKMIDLLTDIRISEARLYQAHSRHYSEDSARLQSQNLYLEIFAKNETDYKEYDKSMRFYSSNPERFQKIYDAVAARLKDSTDKP